MFKAGLFRQKQLWIAVSARYLAKDDLVLSVSIACELENVDMVGLILSYGATVNQRCGQGWTALHEAVSRNNTEICEMVIRAGATINPPNTYSITPLIVAAQRGQMKTLCYLIGKGTFLLKIISLFMFLILILS